MSEFTESKSKSTSKSWIWKCKHLDYLFPKLIITTRWHANLPNDRPVFILDTKANHLTCIYNRDGIWYFIDSNAGPPPTLAMPCICYPKHAVNTKVDGRGQCLPWTVFFLMILMTKGPVDYTIVPKTVLMDLFQNFCHNIQILCSEPPQPSYFDHT